MEELIKILESVKPDIDYKSEKHLIDEELIDSLDIVTIVAKINDEFDNETIGIILCKGGHREGPFLLQGNPTWKWQIPNNYLH